MQPFWIYSLRTDHFADFCPVQRWVSILLAVYGAAVLVASREHSFFICDVRFSGRLITPGQRLLVG